MVSLSAGLVRLTVKVMVGSPPSVAGLGSPAETETVGVSSSVIATLITLGCGAALSIADANRIGLGNGLTKGQSVDCTIGDGEVPSDRPAGSGSGRIRYRPRGPQ